MSSESNPPDDERLAEIDWQEREYSESVVEIEGVVSPNSQGAVHREDYHVHVFSFAAWRVPGGSLVEKQLRILRPVKPDEDWLTEFPKLKVCRIRVLLSIDQSCAVFAGQAPEEANEDQLLAIAETLSKPVVVSTDRLGEFTLNRSDNSFNGEFQSLLFGESIRVMIFGELDIEFVESCVDLFNNLSDDSIEHLCRASQMYCNDSLDAVGEPKVKFENTRSVLDIVYPSALYVPSANQAREPVVHMELNCDWDEEHGMEWVIRKNEVLYVGGYCGCDPYGKYERQDSWNFAWQTKNTS